MKATWTKLDQLLDQIEDPGAGLALLAKRPEGATPEQALDLLFWQIQFIQCRDWGAGDIQAIWRAIASCSLGKKPPPIWLCRAIHELCVRHMSPHDKRAYRRMLEHFGRWETVELVRRKHRRDPRNREKVSDDAIWAEAAELLADEGAEASAAETVRKSHLLI